jgi:tRNA-splicing ligase RtcB
LEQLLCLLILCGSRGIWHQICTDYVQDFQSVAHDTTFTLPDRELGLRALESPREEYSRRVVVRG